jgi:hypothetical protein
MFKCDNCYKSLETGKCLLSVREEDACMTHRFARYDVKIPEAPLARQQHALKRLRDALDLCAVVNLHVFGIENHLCAVDLDLLHRLTVAIGPTAVTSVTVACYHTNPRVTQRVKPVTMYQKLPVVEEKSQDLATAADTDIAIVIAAKTTS